jgi:hypothetical protein
VGKQLDTTVSIFDAIDAYRKQYPELDEALHLYEEARREQEKAWRAMHPCIISIAESTDERNIILSYHIEMNIHQSLTKALAWVILLYRYVKEQHLPWTPPLIPTTERDEVVMEWRNGQKKLTVYVDIDSIDYVQALPSGKMEDGDAGDGRALYEWLVDES